MSVPNHVAIIMDGNGRWAKSRLMPRTFGHEKGAEVARKISNAAKDFGIKYLTLYAFSTENWKRPKDEVDSIMNLLRHYISEIEKSIDKESRICILGDKSKLDSDLQKRLVDVEERTKDRTGFSLNIAINYGGREELIRAFSQIQNEKVEISEEQVNNHLFTKGMPDVDLLIRPGGEKRISNFLLWQVSYAELVFQDTLWPDYTKADLKSALDEYEKRQRRYGGV